MSDDLRHRLIVLGASNVRRGLSALLGVAEELLPGPLDVTAVLGHGRSLGWTSRVFARTLPSMLECGLWNALCDRPALPTTALLTDIGNDIVYGVEVDELLEWVATCLARLTSATRHVVVTQVPLGRVRRIPNWQFTLMKRVMYPGCRLSLAEALDRATAVHDQLPALVERFGATLASPDLAWYGFDPIHVRFRDYARAWRTYLSSAAMIAAGPSDDLARQNGCGKPFRSSLTRWLACRWATQERRSLFGRDQYHPQPSLTLATGTRVSLF